ncbi:type II toxin-antitoxin system PemK/MazF family toxin [Chakrabartyella piscis]|uniref:type II toxin-antitoxin system PemK/MazF family toxin n=1 Tax=Chakrabartyella piscis TaxID=2918914 RepID=UPI002958AB40|nr:type II toxin-antitoxin system PemK/MazF family toxin [Chakrabartyella piscis]
MEERTITRGEIYYANLGAGVGSEQFGIRPVLILQNNVGNRYSPTVIVAPVTTRKKKTMPTHVLVSPIRNLEAHSSVLLEQIRTIDRERLQEYICTVPKYKLKQINRALEISVGLNSNFL